MANEKKQRFLPVRNADDPRKVSLEPVSEEVYQAVEPEILRTQKQMQRLGRCGCPKSKIWVCDADCLLCEFCTMGNQISIDMPIDDEEGITIGDTIVDDGDLPESILLDHDLEEALRCEICNLDPEAQRYCELLMYHSKRDAAGILGVPWSSFKDRWEKIRERLSEKLKDY